MPTDRRSAPRIPGEPGIWLLVCGELAVFTTFFATFLYYRAYDPIGFAEDQAKLSGALGLANTVIMLTSSWCAAQAVIATRKSTWREVTNWLTAAVCCGLAFVLVKALEWGTKINEGILPNSSGFFMYYYMFTGIHLIHVLAGTAVLTFLRQRVVGASPLDASAVRWIEVGATFWHLVDLLWIVLFAILYLVH